MVFHSIPGESVGITILYHAIENTEINTINVTCTWSMMGRLDGIPSNIRWLSCILIGCFFYGMYKYLDVCLDELRCTTHLDIDVPHTTTARQIDCMGILMYS